ncbi:MAG: c-type heme family protein [Thermoanaerobaculia bacterium]
MESAARESLPRVRSRWFASRRRARPRRLAQCLRKEPESRPSADQLRYAFATTSESPAEPPRKLTVWIVAGAAALLVALAGLLAYAFLRHRGPPPSDAIASLAVLPLENLSGEKEQEFFADGMTEALIADLAQISSLRVISRTSVMQYKRARKPLPEIARELGVQGIIEGSVLRAGDRVRITALLIHGPTDRHPWAKSYERPFAHVLALQGEVARAIASEIRATVTPQESARLERRPHVSPRAYELHLKGRFEWNRRDPESLARGRPCSRRRWRSIRRMPRHGPGSPIRMRFASGRTSRPGWLTMQRGARSSWIRAPARRLPRSASRSTQTSVNGKVRRGCNVQHTMRVSALLLSLMLTATCGHAPAPAVSDRRPADAVAEFRTQLQMELKEGMARGPVHAVAVCRDRAPRIAAESGSPTLQLGRTSTRVRNPDNAPAGWLVPVLEHYARHPEDREPRTVVLGDGRSGYVEPITVAPVCLVCHGDAVAPDVSRALQELYPQDRATGYKAGDFRGVFWAVSSGPVAR